MLHVNLCKSRFVTSPSEMNVFFCMHNYLHSDKIFFIRTLLSYINVCTVGLFLSYISLRYVKVWIELEMGVLGKPC